MTELIKRIIQKSPVLKWARGFCFEHGAMSVLGSPVLCAEHIAFPLGKVARCGAARTATDEGRPPAAGVLGTAVISEGSSVGLYPAAHRAAYFPLCYVIFLALPKFILKSLKFSSKVCWQNKIPCYNKTKQRENVLELLWWYVHFFPLRSHFCRTNVLQM